MPKDTAAQDYERILTASLLRVVDFLKFAEAKNAALLTFASAWGLAVTAVIANNRELTGVDLGLLQLGRGLFIVSVLVAIWSLLPKLNPLWFHKNSERSKNLLFYGDIGSFECETFSGKVRQAYLVEGDVVAGERYLDDLTAQIWINSRITLRKNKLFAVGARIALLGVMAAVMPALIAAIHFLGAVLPTAVA